jgi:hypothetical protein
MRSLLEKCHGSAHKIFLEHAPESKIKILLFGGGREFFEILIKLKEIRISVADIPLLLKICVNFNLVKLQFTSR